MKQALILGGTRFFGKRLTQNLVVSGWDVTIATRGHTKDPFGDRVKRIHLDRFSRESMAGALGEGTWDVVFDQICFAPDDAVDSCELFKDRIGRYVYTSTGSVYTQDAERPYREEMFDPFTYGIKAGRREAYTYGEGKRLAEAVFFARAPFPVAAMRIPVVVGPDDYTERLASLVSYVRNGLPFRSPELDLKTGFIHSQEAADFLQWLGEGEMTGPFNAAASGCMQMGELIHLIEDVVGKKAWIYPLADADAPLSGSSCMDTSKARTAGFDFSVLRQWLPLLIQEHSRSHRLKPQLPEE